jgi:hypothetical protein
MAAAPVQLDFSGHLSGFLLRAYLAAIHDPQYAPTERLRAQLEFEAFLLRMGAEMLGPLQSALTSHDTRPEHDVPIAAWFMAFVGALDEAWLRRVQLTTAERFFRTLTDARTRRSAIDLIVKVEAINDPTGAAAEGSLIAGLFQGAQPEPFATPLRPDAALIMDTLATRLRITPPALLDTAQGGLARYTMRVIRYCFKGRFDRFSPQEVDYVSTLINLRDELRNRLNFTLTNL